MTTQWFKYSVERVPGEFECLARAMKKNLVRQREFSILLRLLSTRFASGSNESQMLRDASRTARNKGRRLRDLLSDLNYRIPKSKCRHPSFLIRSHLIKLMPPRLMVAWLSRIMEKSVRARLVGPFGKAQRKGKCDERQRTSINASERQCIVR
jgi:hypothetical protein